MDDYSPIETVERALRWWWLVALLVICGGGVGWLFHLALPPLYDARVVFTAAVDFKQAGSIDTLEQDKSIAVIGDTIDAPATLKLVAADAQAAGIQTDPQGLLAMSFLERKSEIWELRVRNANPAVAQTIANLWADRANAALKTDLKHALQADALHQQLMVLSACLQQAAVPTSSTDLCQATSPADVSALSAQYGKISDALYAEMLASSGMPAWLLFSLQQKADLPAQPVVYGANTLVLAGSLIGFLLALWAAASSLLDRAAARLVRRRPIPPPATLNDQAEGRRS